MFSMKIPWLKDHHQVVSLCLERRSGRDDNVKALLWLCSAKRCAFFVSHCQLESLVVYGHFQNFLLLKLNSTCLILKLNSTCLILKLNSTCLILKLNISENIGCLGLFIVEDIF